MIKIDYEGAWKELKERCGNCIIEPIEGELNFNDAIQELEQKHTHNYIDIRKRSDKEIADYCLKKHAEIYLENIHLKKALKEWRKSGFKEYKDTKIEGGYLFRDDGGYGTEMIKKYKEMMRKEKKQ